MYIEYEDEIGVELPNFEFKTITVLPEVNNDLYNFFSLDYIKYIKYIPHTNNSRIV